MGKIWNQHKRFLTFVALMFVFRSAIADWNYIPSSSMNPTLVAGDRVLVNKLAYSLRVPFTLVEILRWSKPKAGDVVILVSPEDGKTLIKRVVAVGGDTISMKDNVLYLNGQAQTRSLKSEDAWVPTESGMLQIEVWREQLGDARYETARIPMFNHRVDFSAVEVPAGQVMVMGDSRDNSRDSRFFGLVDTSLITGRAERVVMSHNPDALYMPRKQRWWLPMVQPQNAGG
ncbi:signal peptidase I [Hydrogenophaga sp. 5NK40-0174]|uniref:signal peptidase I n=1 Tax=Hydrogenophaga sp. 5NK40-0174 TaxID=3127649 RepID=UPI0031051518